MVWLPDGGKSLIICLAILTEYTRVTNRQSLVNSRIIYQIINYVLNLDLPL